MTFARRFQVPAMIAAFAAIFACGGPATAGDEAVKAFQGAAYAGNFQGGIARLDRMRTADSSDTEALIGLGAMRFFGAVAGLQKDLYAHSTSIAAGDSLGLLGIGLLPMAGMGGVVLVPPSPNATPMTYRALRTILARFAERLTEAEATLALVGERPVKLPLRPFDIAIDLDHNGKIEERERILVALLASSGGRLREAAFGAEIAFDTADASWLRGYSHVLLASVNLVLAFDFEASYNVAAHNLYGDAATAFGALMAKQANLGRPRGEIDADLAAVREDIKALRRDQTTNRDIRDLRKHLQELPDTAQNADQRRLYEQALQSMQDSSRAYSEKQSKLYQRQRQLMRERDGYAAGSMFDAVALLHTLNWPVVEPPRLRAARRHLVQVMEINHTTWRLARRETDDDREWLPNAKQTPPFGANRITDEVIDSWLAATALAVEVLEGRKLLPHPRFKKGINLKRLFESAKRIDFVLLATGHDLLPYLEDGEVVDEKAWSAITAPMGRNVAQYAIWFN